MNIRTKTYNLTILFILLTSLCLSSINHSQNFRDIDENPTNTLIDEGKKIDTVSYVEQKIMSSAEYDEETPADYIWWDPAWTFRVPLSINSTNITRTRFSVDINVNFTEILDSLVGYDASGKELDENSTRIVEYDGNKNLIVMNNELGTDKYLIPSLFIPERDPTIYNSSENAIGKLRFEMNGTSSANTTRTFMVYFDTIDSETGIKGVPDDQFLWKTEYDATTDFIGDGKQHLAYGANNFNVGTEGIEIMSSNDFNTVDRIETSYIGSVANYYNMYPGDFNGDGNIELVVSDIHNYFHFLDYVDGDYETIFDEVGVTTTTGSYLFDSMTETYVDTRHHQTICGDVDGDGKDEIIAGTYAYPNGQLRIYGLNDSDVLEVEELITLPNNMRSIQTALADFDKDGMLDIVTGSWDNQASYDFCVVGMNSTGEYEVKEYVNEIGNTEMPPYVGSLQVADIDNDGNIEIVMGRYDGGTSEYTYIWQWDNSQPKGSRLDFEVKFQTGIYHHIISDIMDWDNDGKMEILVSNYHANATTNISVFEVSGRDGDDAIINSTAEWSTSVAYYQPRWGAKFGDVNNDGIIEIFGGSYTVDRGIQIWSKAGGSTPLWESGLDYDYVGATRSQSNILGGRTGYVVKNQPDFCFHDGMVKKADMTFTVLDIDHYPVEGLKITLYNSSGVDPVNQINSGFSDSDGILFIDDLDLVDYEYQVNITSELGEEIVIDGSYHMDDIHEFEDILTDIWQIHFEVEDISGNPFTIGNISVFEGSVQDDVLISNLKIDETTGEATFKFFSRSETENAYNYTIEHVNNNYDPSITSLINLTANQHTPNILETFVDDAQDQGLGEYDQNWLQQCYAFDSTSSDFGNQKITWMELNFTNFDTGENITKILIDGYINPTTTIRLAELFLDSNPIIANYSLNLSLYEYDIYGIDIRTTFHDTNETHDFNMSLQIEQMFVENITVDCAQYDIFIVDENGLPASGINVLIYDDFITDVDGYRGNTVAELMTDTEGVALDALGNPFWYLLKDGITEKNYTIKLDFFGEKAFANGSVFGQIRFLNFTLTEKSSVNLNVTLDMSIFTTEIRLVNDPANVVEFKGAVEYLFEINVTDDGSLGEPINDRVNADIVYLELFDASNDLVFSNFSYYSSEIGLYSFIIQPELDNIAVNFDLRTYTVKIGAETLGYANNPEPKLRSLTINPINADGEIYNTATGAKITNNTISTYWGSEYQVTFVYLEGATNLVGATAIIDSEFFSNEAMTEVSGGGYVNYTYTINTSKAPRIGQYRMTFSVSLANYETISTSYVDLRINLNPTGLNSTSEDLTSELLVISKTIRQNDTYNFEFNYVKSLEGNSRIYNATKYEYSWSKIGTNDFGSNLPMDISGDGGTYILDFNTKNLTTGTYILLVGIGEGQYEERNAMIYLTVEKRLIDFSYGEDLSESIEKVSGDKISLSITLTDKDTGFPILDATVVIRFNNTLNDIVLTDENNDGIYVSNKTFTSDEVNAFFRDQNFLGRLNITSELYASVEEVVSFTVKMKEIFNNVPLFYALLLASMVAIFIVGIGGYKVYQTAQIPAFVRLINKLDKDISDNKEVSKENITLTNEEQFMEELADEWKILDLDIRSIWGSVGKVEYSDDNMSDGDKPSNQGGI